MALAQTSVLRYCLPVETRIGPVSSGNSISGLLVLSWILTCDVDMLCIWLLCGYATTHGHLEKSWSRRNSATVYLVHRLGHFVPLVEHFELAQ
jgi:hypothetical protein